MNNTHKPHINPHQVYPQVISRAGKGSVPEGTHATDCETSLTQLDNLNLVSHETQVISHSVGDLGLDRHHYWRDLSTWYTSIVQQD